MDKKKINIILLVAGFGSRIRDLTNEPKCLLKINKKSILEYNLKNFEKIGASRITVIGGYKFNILKKEIEKFNNNKIKLIKNVNYNNKGNSHSIKLGINNNLNFNSTIILDGDLLYDFKILKEFLKKNINKNSLLVGKGNIADKECAKVLIKNDNSIAKVIDKSYIDKLTLKKLKFVGEAPGIILFNKKGLKSFSKNLNKFLEKNYLMNWEKAINFHCIKDKIYYHFTKSVKWIEIDTKADFKKAKIIFKKNYQK